LGQKVCPRFKKKSEEREKGEREREKVRKVLREKGSVMG
jgi:hypothetical protein